MATWFDESRLDDEATLAAADAALRPLAEAGARVRREAHDAQEATREALSRSRDLSRPRAVIAAGPDSRLLRAVLEPWCPVPFVAWPGPALPGWAGSLDLVVMLAPGGSDAGSAAAVAEAVRRGCQVVVACPPKSLVAEHAAGRDVTILPTVTGDQLAMAVVMLEFLEQIHLGPRADAEVVANALEAVAIACSPHRDLAINPAKMLAIALADTNPIVWGGIGAGGQRRAPGRRVDPPGQRPVGDRGRHGAPAPRARGDPAARRVRRPLRRRAPRATFDRSSWCSTTAPRRRWSASSAAGCWPAPPRAAYASRPSTPTPTPSSPATASLLLSGTYAAEYLRIGLVED